MFTKGGRRRFEYAHPFMTKDMSHIVMKLVLLDRIAKNEVYSYALVKELSTSKFSHFMRKYSIDTKNDIYNTVKALEKGGYVKVKARVDDGKLKKYYHITQRGRNALKESKKLFVNSMSELMKIVG
ncbi:MAG: PadR family transcriptional regulator [Candidatus Micrarchaeaceae archaeon]